jgi:hypothetical protein
MRVQHLFTNIRGTASRLLAIMAIGVSSGRVARGEQEAWSECSLPPAQFVLQIPASLVHSTAPSATGCSFQTSDGLFNVEAVAPTESNANPDSLDQRMEKEIKLLSASVSHQKKGDNWFSLSGITPDGTEFYRKLVTNGSQWVTLRITFPHAQSKKYDRWVKRIDKTFAPFGENAETKVSPTAPNSN